ncbi:MAG: hypothetical protein IJS09_07255, partial [Treponema sp.]|nr:hypothetical protein [Treponema sp.]
LEKTEAKLETGSKGRNFLVFGLSTNYNTGRISYYASKYYNIGDINAKNFGATALSGDTLATAIQNGTACEYDITSGLQPFASTSATSQLAFWADIYPTVKTGKTHKIGETDDTKDFTGGYTVDLYTGTAGDEDLSKLTKVKSIDIPTSVTGYVAGDATEGTQVPQNYLAVYANVYTGKTLNGAWYLKQDYYEADTVEE